MLQQMLPPVMISVAQNLGVYNNQVVRTLLKTVLFLLLIYFFIGKYSWSQKACGKQPIVTELVIIIWIKESTIKATLELNEKFSTCFLLM